MPMCFVAANVQVAHLHIFSDWLKTTKSNIQSSIWATNRKLALWIGKLQKVSIDSLDNQWRGIVMFTHSSL